FKRMIHACVLFLVFCAPFFMRLFIYHRSILFCLSRALLRHLLQRLLCGYSTGRPKLSLRRRSAARSHPEKLGLVPACPLLLIFLPVLTDPLKGVACLHTTTLHCPFLG